MIERYFDSVKEAKTAYPDFVAAKSKKTTEMNGRIFTKIGTANKEHGSLRQAACLIEAIALSTLSLLLIPLLIPSYRNYVGKLWSQAFSGTEKLSLYVVDKEAEVRVEQVRAQEQVRKLESHAYREAVEKALKKVRKNADNLTKLPLEMRDNEEVVLAAIEKSYSAIMQHASPRLQNTKRVALAAVQKNADNLKHLHANMRDDKEVTLAAIKKSYSAFDHASPGMQRDPEVQEARRKAKAELDELMARYGMGQPFFGNQHGYSYPQQPQAAAYAPKTPAKKKWQCPLELKNDPTESGAFIRKVLEEAANSELNFTSDTSNADKIVFRRALCKMLGLEETHQDSAIKALYKLQILHLHPDKRPNDPHAAEAFRNLKVAYKVTFK